MYVMCGDCIKGNMKFLSGFVVFFDERWLMVGVCGFVE